MAGPIDIESLLWEARELLRDLSKVSKAQAAEIERLGGRPWDLARELQERADGAVASCDAALEQWQSDNEDDTVSSIGGRVDVAAWLEATRQLQEDAHGENAGDISFASANSSFWRPQGFNWADEPTIDEEDEDEEEEDNSNSMGNVPELLHDLEDSGNVDSGSDSGDSFVSADMMAHSGLDVDAVDAVYGYDDVAAVRGRRYSTSDARATVDLAVDDSAPTTSYEPVKGPSYPGSLHPKAAPHLRRAVRMRIESLPNMDRLYALRE